MPKILLDLWNNKTTRATIIRVLVGLVGYFVHQGTIPIPDWFYVIVNDPGMITMISALGIPAGQMNNEKVSMKSFG